MIDATIIVLAKEPVPGRVKTRLCPPCTPEQAAAIATVALELTLRSVAAVPNVRRVVALDGRPGPWLPRGFEVVPQVAGDLGDRLAGAFAATSGPALLVGMDTPQITAPQLRALVDHVRVPHVDAILGLTLDGGWWTLGVTDARADLFTDVPMSSPSTGRHQWERLQSLGLRVHLAPAAVDVDDFASARYVADLMPRSRFAAAVHAVASSLPDSLTEIAS